MQVFGHTITDPGPLPYRPRSLHLTLWAIRIPMPHNINEDAKENAFEGMYLDDF